jgi:hypothetical protein
MKESKVKYPAEYEVYWPTGPVPCCDKHASALIRLGSMLGQNIGASVIQGEEVECMNCVNEN